MGRVKDSVFACQKAESSGSGVFFAQTRNAGPSCIFVLPGKAMAGAKGGHVMRRMVLVNYLSDVTFRRVILQKALPLHSLHLESKPSKLLRHKTSPQPIGLGGEGINLWFKSPLA